MGSIADSSLDKIREAIRNSNKQAAQGRPQYLIWEDRALHSDYEFIACPCGGLCWCKRNGCGGHYRLKEVTFERFLETYATLWTPNRRALRQAVLGGIRFKGRGQNAVEPLQWLSERWPSILGDVRRYDKCGLCDSSAPPLVTRVGIFNLWDAKIWSQLYYDSLIPFDYESKRKIKNAGYPDPTIDFLATNRELFGDLRKFSDSHGLGVRGLRDLDSPWTVEPQYRKSSVGQPLSRVVDKIFYIP